MSDQQRDVRQAAVRQAIAHPGFRESFEAVAANARKVLRERGLSDDQIEDELSRSHRDAGLADETGKSN